MGDYHGSPRWGPHRGGGGAATDIDEAAGDVSIPRVTDTETNASDLQQLPQQQVNELPGYSEVLIDRTIDPEKYLIGAGDLIGIYLWGELDQQYQERVTPEGLLNIPTVGSIPVADISLAAASRAIREAVHGKYKDIDVSVYLVDPRRFRLSIAGMVENPGMFEAHPLMRISDLLEGVSMRAAGIENLNVARVMEQELVVERQGVMFANRCRYYLRGQSLSGGKRGSSTRSILIYRGDKVITVDLLRYAKLGELNYNPYVNGGDRVLVPPYLGDIFVNGEVNRGGIYEFREGDTVADLVAFGGGLTALADTSQAKLARFDDAGRELTFITIDLNDAIISNPDNPKYRLRESDRLFIKAKYDYKVLANITVQGQVHFPGDYAITPHLTKLTDVISMAGGFTENANLEEARIIRRTTSNLRDLEYERLRTMSVREMTDEEYEYYKQRSRIAQGLITIDFVGLFQDGDMSKDLYLEPGDYIFIPAKRDLVNVLGAVIEPGFVGWEENADAEAYIVKAGGYNWNAKQRDVRIIKAKTGQRLKPGGDVLIEGGDTILVSEKRPVNYWQAFRDTATLFADLATLVIIARNVITK